MACLQFLTYLMQRFLVIGFVVASVLGFQNESEHGSVSNTTPPRNEYVLFQNVFFVDFPKPEPILIRLFFTSFRMFSNAFSMMFVNDPDPLVIETARQTRLSSLVKMVVTDPSRAVEDTRDLIFFVNNHSKIDVYKTPRCKTMASYKRYTRFKDFDAGLESRVALPHDPLKAFLDLLLTHGPEGLLYYGLPCLMIVCFLVR